ncbi:MAG: hypothetical protein ACRDK3_02250 [Actinomycetota bacterium]
MSGIAALLWDAPYTLMLPALFGAFVSMMFRYRRAADVERLQLKFFLFALAISLVGIIVGPISSAEGSGNELLASVGVLLLPIATGLAILRYRLYDIDRIISRTLVYSVVVLLLGLTYAGVVLSIQATLPIDDDSPLIVAVSTLAVVALFRPLQARIRDLVDRRFYRRSYDARVTLDGFSARLRSEIDLGDLESDLLAVVLDTVRPTHCSLWLSGSEAPR